MMSLEDLFCSVDDFCQTFEPQWEHQLLENGLQQRKQSRSLCLSEIMTILISFHQRMETTGVQLITKLRRNMKNRLMRLSDRLLLRKRSIIATVIDQLKNIPQIEHSRHRSPVNCLVNIVCGLIAYCHQPKKPSIALDHHLLPAA